MLEDLIGKAKKEGLKLAPFIGIGCPGIITKDGAIDRGAQNLPGNWESSNFHLPGAIHEAIPKIGDDETAIVMHNDAVVQGLSEVPFMQRRRALGRADHRHRARQRALHQPQGRIGTRRPGGVLPAPHFPDTIRQTRTRGVAAVSGRFCDITLTVNGETVHETVEARKTLVDFLRERLALTGSHVGCEHGVCGACTVRVDGAIVRGCLMLAGAMRRRQRSRPSKACPTRARSPTCRRRSRSATRCNAVSARPACC